MSRYRNLLGSFRADAFLSGSAICVPTTEGRTRVLWAFESPDVAAASLRRWQEEADAPTFEQKVLANMTLPAFPILPGGYFIPKGGK